MGEVSIAAASIGTSFEQDVPSIHGNAVNGEFLAFLAAGGMRDVHVDPAMKSKSTQKGSQWRSRNF